MIKSFAYNTGLAVKQAGKLVLPISRWAVNTAKDVTVEFTKGLTQQPTLIQSDKHTEEVNIDQELAEAIHAEPAHDQQANNAPQQS